METNDTRDVMGHGVVLGGLRRTRVVVFVASILVFRLVESVRRLK